MDKLTYNEIQIMRQKDLEHLLWQVFWSYSQELGLDESEAKKEEMIERAAITIPDFAESATGLELLFDYPVIYMFLASLQGQNNYLKTPECIEFMKMEGPDNDAKLAYLVAEIKSKGDKNPCQHRLLPPPSPLYYLEQKVFVTSVKTFFR